MDFCVPDMKGNQPRNQFICNMTKSSLIYSQLKLQACIDHLKDPLIALSEDAGDYICNYTYYKACKKVGTLNRDLAKDDENVVFALFVHWPDFADVSEEICQ